MTVNGGAERKALVLYGSETGNAQDAAEELARLARRLHFAVVVSTLDAVSLNALRQYSIIIISVSTTGQGDLPRNAQGFWKRLLRKKLPPTALLGVRYAIIGLGDSSYLQFNYAALKLSKRFAHLGAEEVLTIGEADEQHAEGTDDVLIPWIEKLKTRLLELWPLEPPLEIIADTALLQPNWLLETTNETILLSGTPPDHSKTGAISEGDQNSVRLSVTLEQNRRVTPREHFQDVRHLVFTSKAKLNYVPGDILEIYPHNSNEDVQGILEMMQWLKVADTEVHFVSNQANHLFTPGTAPQLHPNSTANGMTLRIILSESIDLNAIPKRSFFRLASHFTDDEVQKERLQEFANPEFTDELFDYTTRPRRNIMEVLQEFDTVKIPWQWLFEVFPPLRGRQFSIASGGKLKSDADGHARFELLVAVVKYKTVIKKIRRGVCTRYIEEMEVNSSLNVTFIPGSLRISNQHADEPVVLIGPGTGVAPLRALLWEKNAHPSASARTLESVPSNVLFFGCRNRAADFFFADEWHELRRHLSMEVFAACSRDQPQKIYVQDLIREQGALLFRMLHRDRRGIVLVCGASGKMPQAVRAALADILQEGLESPREEAEEYLRSMEKTGRYLQETW